MDPNNAPFWNAAHTAPAPQLPFWLTQGQTNYDPQQLGVPNLNLGFNIGTPNLGQAIEAPAAPAAPPIPDVLGQAIPPATPPGMVSGPPKGPAEQAARKQGWMETLNSVLSDPVKGSALLRMGLQLMQPVPVGQSAAGHFGKAVLSGADYMEKRRAEDISDTNRGGLTKAEINLKNAQADYYRTTKGKGGTAGGGTAARVQQVKQIAAALIATHPDIYQGAKGEAQAVLDAQEELTKLEREKIAAGIFRGTYLPGTDPGAASTTAKSVAESLKATGKPVAIAPAGRPPVPAGAQTGTKDGRRVYTLDGKTFFDIETGQQVP